MCQSPRKQHAALPFQTLKILFCRIPIFRLGKLFVNHYHSHIWDHRVILEGLNISSRTSVDWRLFYSEVTDTWFNNKDSVGCKGVKVEFDETVIVRRKFNRSRVLKQLLLFGIEVKQTKVCHLKRSH